MITNSDIKAKFDKLENWQVRIIHTDERGIKEFAVVWDAEPDNWIDCFPTFEEAEKFCDEREFGVIMIRCTVYDPKWECDCGCGRDI